jgi:peptidoglycan hydrolase-like protein with peptidoglycan-binding domain
MTPISVTFSSAIASSSTLPALDPSTSGSWAVHGETLTFTPTEAFVPLTEVTVSVPAGIEAADGTMLARAEAATFEIVGGSPLRLQQLLSQLDYSPLSWAPSGSAISPSDAVAQRAALFDPPTGTFSWRQTGWPSQLLSMWKEGHFNVMTRGLVMSFQADHGLDASGEPTAGLWNDLLSVLAAGDLNTGGYNFALANQAKPESLTIWHNGAMVLRVPMNSGIPVVAGRGGAQCEIGGTAALYVDVDDVASIAEGLRRAVEPSMRAQARIDGPRRLAELRRLTGTDALCEFLAQDG